MTRKEQIEQASILHSEIVRNNSNIDEDFIEGAEWADATAWKPSDEQMEVLFALLPTTCSSNPIFSLYEDLKKLKGE